MAKLSKKARKEQIIENLTRCIEIGGNLRNDSRTKSNVGTNQK